MAERTPRSDVLDDVIQVLVDHVARLAAAVDVVTECAGAEALAGRVRTRSSIPVDGGGLEAVEADLTAVEERLVALVRALAVTP